MSPMLVVRIGGRVGQKLQTYKINEDNYTQAQNMLTYFLMERIQTLLKCLSATMMYFGEMNRLVNL